MEIRVSTVKQFYPPKSLGFLHGFLIKTQNQYQDSHRGQNDPLTVESMQIKVKTETRENLGKTGKIDKQAKISKEKQRKTTNTGII